MKPDGKPFFVTYFGEQLKVEYYKTGEKPIFQVHFTRKQPLFVTQMKLSEGNIVWTSVPQGRQEEAEEIGDFIDRELNKPEPPKPQQTSLF